MPQNESSSTFREAFGEAEANLRSSEQGAGAQESSSSPVPCSFLTGRAGSGKTYRIREDIKLDPTSGLLCSTTGISAVNLGATTINSALGYFTTDSMRDAYLTGKLSRKLQTIAKSHRRIYVDEVSMMPDEQVDILYRAVEEANQFKDVKIPLGITLVGDFAQLPPVRARWAFEAQHWSKFESNMTVLTTTWRQDEPDFLNALNFARHGNGEASAAIFSSAGIEWHSARDTDFVGTTILPLNDNVDAHNKLVLDKMPGPSTFVTADRWGWQRSEWDKKLVRGKYVWGIPPQFEFKIGAYIMLLVNNAEWNYANGDCGHIREYNPDRKEFTVELVRNQKRVIVPKLTWDNAFKEPPDHFPSDKHLPIVDGYLPSPHRNDIKYYVAGQIRYFPMRLAYASSVHKSQGLTLDRVQIDFRERFFGTYAMLYVALSRCRNLAGLRLVGQRERFVKQVSADPRIARWL